jgi:hypothetical protein
MLAASLAAQQSAPFPVTIRVRDTTGAAIPHARVWIATASLNQPEGLEADNSGTLTVDLQPGNYGVLIKHDGFVELRKQINVQDSPKQTLQMAMAIGPCISEDQRFETESPVNSSMFSEDQPIGSLKTTADGQGAQTLGLDTQQATRIPATLQVTDQSGSDIPHAQIKLVPPPGSFSEKLETEGDGKLTVNLKPGSYDVSVNFPGFFLLTKQIVVQDSKAQIFQLALNVGTCPPGPCFTVSTAPSIEPEPSVSSSMFSEEQPAGSLKITVVGHEAQTISLAALKALPHHTVTVHNPHTNADETYSGVPLIDLLASRGVPHGKDLHGKALSDYIVVTGSDGYKAVLALAEVDPEFHPGEVLVADTQDGKPLDAKTGPFRLVVTEDKRPARSVHNLVSIEVKAAE